MFALESDTCREGCAADGVLFSENILYMSRYLCRESPFVSFDCLGQKNFGGGRFKVCHRKHDTKGADVRVLF